MLKSIYKRTSQENNVVNGSDKSGKLAKLPRRDLIEVQMTDVTPPMMEAVSFNLNYFRVIWSFFVWVAIAMMFVFGNMWDWVIGKSSQIRQANRLRKILDKRGGTCRKIGQLLAVRVDILPWVYCVELSKIVDQMRPFPKEYAIEAVEKAIGKPIEAGFRQFDPSPIIASSMACTYQAILNDGEKVAVKIRRPNIGNVILADIKSMEWILSFFEFVSILRPGFTRDLVKVLMVTIKEELDFIQEARYQLLFRRAAKKSGKKFFNAPNVFFEFCTQEVIVESYEAGMWLWEVIAAYDNNDSEALATAIRLNIDPEKVAKRLMWVNFWALDAHLLFLADVQPDNVIVRRDSKLTFTNFNSVGTLGKEKRQAFRQTIYYAQKREPLGMAQASMVLLEPLPPIDLIEFTKDLEASYWQYIYALESRYVEWWERTSVLLWSGFVRICREHYVKINLHILRMVRACLLFDTLAARLSPGINLVDEYAKYSDYDARRAKYRIMKSINRQLTIGLDDRGYKQIEEIIDTGERLFHQLQRILSTPIIKFNAVLGKSVYFFSTMVRLAGHALIVTALMMSIYLLDGWRATEQIGNLVDVFYNTVSNRVYQFVVLFLLIINFRTILFRLSDKDID